MMMVFRWWFVEWQQGGVSGVVDDDDGGCSGGAGCGVVGTATVVVAVAARGVGSVWRGDSGDRKVRIIFGFAGKSPPEKFFGDGRRRRLAGGGGGSRRLLGVKESRENLSLCVY
uniref:Uncharacterized protein n=1 Tax=Tanacetum cinerariifolium TaxID=118510 RepID=A0A699TTJ8_TANCI|nr:hypothetical protein [Tanacetum cinerariifolium]